MGPLLNALRLQTIQALCNALDCNLSDFCEVVPDTEKEQQKQRKVAGGTPVRLYGAERTSEKPGEPLPYSLSVPRRSGKVSLAQGKRARREVWITYLIRTAHYVYMVGACANGTLYTGYTINVERRIALHNAGKGARYTRSHRPVTLVATWTFNTKGEALRAERELKHLPREQKMEGGRAGHLS